MRPNKRNDNLYYSLLINNLTRIGKPAQVLVLVGTLNGLVLPIAMVIVLIAAYRKNIVGDYKHPIWIAAFGWIIAIAMSILSVMTIAKYVARFTGAA